MEAVNRFETFLINQIEDSKKMIKELGHPNVKIMADIANKVYSHYSDNSVKIAASAK